MGFCLNGINFAHFFLIFFFFLNFCPRDFFSVPHMKVIAERHQMNNFKKITSWFVRGVLSIFLCPILVIFIVLSKHTDIFK